MGVRQVTPVRRAPADETAHLQACRNMLLWKIGFFRIDVPVAISSAFIFTDDPAVVGPVQIWHLEDRD